MARLITFGIVLTAIAIGSLMMALAVTLMLPVGFWIGAKEANAEFDDWAESCPLGDRILVSGKISKEAHFEFGSIQIWLYRFEDCKTNFSSTVDLGDPGDPIVVEIEKTSLGYEAVSRPRGWAVWAPNICCVVLSSALLLFGLLVLFSGILRRRRV